MDQRLGDRRAAFFRMRSCWSGVPQQGRGGDRIRSDLDQAPSRSRLHPDRQPDPAAQSTAQTENQLLRRPPRLDHRHGQVAVVGVSAMRFPIRVLPDNATGFRPSRVGVDRSRDPDHPVSEQLGIRDNRHHSVGVDRAEPPCHHHRRTLCPPDLRLLVYQSRGPNATTCGHVTQSSPGCPTQHCATTGSCRNPGPTVRSTVPALGRGNTRRASQRPNQVLDASSLARPQWEHERRRGETWDEPQGGAVVEVRPRAR